MASCFNCLYGMQYDQQIRLATLMAAIDGGHHEFVSILVENGVNVNAILSVSLEWLAFRASELFSSNLYLRVPVLSYFELGLPS